MKQPTKKQCIKCSKEYKTGKSNGQPNLSTTGYCRVCDPTVPDHMKPTQKGQRADLPPELSDKVFYKNRNLNMKCVKCENYAAVKRGITLKYIIDNHKTYKFECQNCRRENKMKLKAQEQLEQLDLVIEPPKPATDKPLLQKRSKPAPKYRFDKGSRGR